MMQAENSIVGLYEVLSLAGKTRFFLETSIESMYALLDANPGMMGEGIAGESIVQVVDGDREAQLDRVMQFVPEFFAKRWCQGGLCGCMGCVNRAGEIGRLGFTEPEWKSWQSRQIRFIAKQPA